MKNLPVRRNQFKTADFAAWLAANGAEVGTPTNPYEVIRYRAYDGGNRAATHIVYAKESGLLTFTAASKSHYTQFLTGSQIYPTKRQATPPQKNREAIEGPSKASKLRAKLLERDGDECWFCGHTMGEDITVEHLVPKSKGGRNMLANYSLAHAACNHRAADMPLIQKIELRASLRGAVKQLADSTPNHIEHRESGE